CPATAAPLCGSARGRPAACEAFRPFPRRAGRGDDHAPAHPARGARTPARAGPPPLTTRGRVARAAPPPPRGRRAAFSGPPAFLPSPRPPPLEAFPVATQDGVAATPARHCRVGGYLSL